ncbi:cytochrome c biogenesis protein CcdA [Oceanobacillus massiliensis]
MGSFFVGVIFSAGWTPCIGPILSSVLSLSVANPNEGLYYISAYTLGFAIPFLVLSFFIGKSRLLLRYSDKVMKFGGLIMVFVGILLFFNKMASLGLWLTDLFGGFSGF